MKFVKQLDEETKQELDSNPEKLNPLLKQLMLILQGGEAIENLYKGNASPSGTVDRIENAVLTIAALLAQACFIRNGDELIAMLRFLPNKKQEAQDILLRFDYNVVQELAERLRQEQEWDQATIEEIIWEYKLDQNQVEIA